MDRVLLISILSGLATGIGGLIVIWFGSPTKRVLSFYLGLSAGMMGMVVLVDLLPASLQYGSFRYTIIGLILGIMLMLLFDKALSSSFLEMNSDNINSNSNNNNNNNNFQKGIKPYRNLGYFMTLAIALHNIPEGLAIGAGFESQEELGVRVAMIIALHNIPEGLGVAATLYLGKLPKSLVFLLPLATGFFIPIGTLISQLLGQYIPYWISIGLSFAAGAMGYIVIKDIMPESFKLNRLLGQFGVGVGILILYIVYRLNGN